MIRNDEAFIGGQIPGGGGGRRSSKPERLTSQPQKFDLLQLKKPVFEQVQGSPERDPYGAAALGLSKDIAEYLHEKAEDYRNVRRNEELADLQNGSQIYAQDFLSKSESGIGLTKAVLEDFDKRLDKSIVDYEDDEKDKIRLRASGLRKSISKACMLREIDALEKFNIKSGENTRFSLLNNLYVSPEQEPELRKVYDASVDVNKGKIRAVLFDKFKDEKTAAWNKTYAQALINSNPFDYENILKRNEFKALDQASYQQLWNYGSSVAHKAERAILLQKEELRKEENRRQDKLIKRTVDDIEEHPNKYTMKDIDGFAKEYGFDENHGYDLRHKFRKAMEKYNKNAEEEDKIKDSLAKGEPIPDVSTEQKNKYFYKKHIKDLNDKRAAEGKPKLSLSEIVKEAKEYAVTFSGVSDSLKSAVVTSVMNGKDAKTVMDACSAVKDSEKVPMIKGIDNDVVFFSSIAVDYYKATRDSKNLLELRDKFFAQSDEKTRLYREEQWKKEEYGKADKKDDALYAFLKRNGFATEEHWRIFGGDKIPATIEDDFKAQAHDILKRVYMKTGSVSIAESVASNILSNHFGVSDINGDEEKMYNPPTEANTKLSAIAIANFVAERGQDLMESIEKAGDKYKGYIPVKRVHQGDKKGNITGFHNFIKDDKNIQPSDFYKKDLVKDKSRKIQAFIGGKWEARSLQIEATPINDSTYCYYILLDESNALSKEYLIDPETGKRALMNFRGIERMK